MSQWKGQALWVSLIINENIVGGTLSALFLYWNTLYVRLTAGGWRVAHEVRGPGDGGGRLPARLPQPELGAVQAARRLGRHRGAAGRRPQGEQEPGRGDQGPAGSARGGRQVHPRAGQAEEEAAGQLLLITLQAPLP